MARHKPTLEEKRDAARKVILENALELFFVKGFRETTTRDIVSKAGILNGSLYNRFKSKDEILVSIVKEAVIKVIDETSKVLDKEHNILISSSFPGALQLYAASRSSRMASLLYEVHCMWDAVEIYTSINLERASENLADYGFDSMNPELLRMKIIGLVGQIGDMIGYYYHGGTLDYRMAVREHMLNVAASLQMPVVNIDVLVDRLVRIVESEDLVFLGYKISKDVPEFRKQSEDD